MYTSIQKKNKKKLFFIFRIIEPIRNNGRVVQQRKITQGPDWLLVFISDGRSVAAWAELRSWLEGLDQLTLTCPRSGCGRRPDVSRSPDWAAAESESSEWAPWSLPAWFSSFAGETNPIDSSADQSLEEGSLEDTNK